MAVSLAICEISSVRERRNLEKRVMACSRSLQMASFDRSCTTSYWSGTVKLLYLVSFPRKSEILVENNAFSQFQHCRNYHS